MYGWLGIPSFLQTDDQRKMVKAAMEKRLENAVPWSEKMRWEPRLTIDASTFDMSEFDWFPELETVDGPRCNGIGETQRADSPTKQFRFVRKTLKRGQRLQTIYSNRQGDVVFNGDVTFPAIHGWNEHAKRFHRAPWMSMTPMEVFTCRGGIRAAKGNVIVAGLGLGYQLVRISNKKSVKSVTLVERSGELVRWLYPKIKPRLGCKVYVQVADARRVVPAMEADVAVIDIDSSYGWNEFPDCPKIGRVWVWGSSKTR